MLLRTALFWAITQGKQQLLTDVSGKHRSHFQENNPKESSYHLAAEA